MSRPCSARFLVNQWSIFFVIRCRFIFRTRTISDLFWLWLWATISFPVVLRVLFKPRYLPDSCYPLVSEHGNGKPAFLKYLVPSKSQFASTWLPTTMSGRPKVRSCVWSYTILRVPKIGVPQNGWFTRENPTQMDELGVTPILGNPHMNGYDQIVSSSPTLWPFTSSKSVSNPIYC